MYFQFYWTNAPQDCCKGKKMIKPRYIAFPLNVKACFFFFQSLLLFIGYFFPMQCEGGDSPHQFYAGPEIYHVKRLRSGGTRQGGMLYGARIGYDYLKRYKIYVGGDVLAATGTLRGVNGNRDTLKSRFTDFDIEGRVGYTLAQKCSPCPSITPFIGYGYAEELNKFISPSPLQVHFKTFYQYVSYGFLAKTHVSERWDMGVNFKAKYLVDARNRVTHDSEYDSFTMRVGPETHYRVELPISYEFKDRFFVQFVPFFEYRHYGKQANYPFDFFETRFRIYGAAIRLKYKLYKC